MYFDPENNIVKLCAKGMELEGKGQSADALAIFTEAWEKAVTDFEKFTAAHYVARQQKSTEEKLKWDTIALQYALNIPDETIKTVLPSLYLNIGKCYEDLGDTIRAKQTYEAAYSFIDFLPDDGYGKMMRSGVVNAVQKMKAHF